MQVYELLYNRENYSRLKGCMDVVLLLRLSHSCQIESIPRRCVTKTGKRQWTEINCGSSSIESDMDGTDLIWSSFSLSLASLRVLRVLTNLMNMSADLVLVLVVLAFRYFHVHINIILIWTYQQPQQDGKKQCCSYDDKVMIIYILVVVYYLLLSHLLLLLIIIILLLD